jgi:hypothetical protein
MGGALPEKEDLAAWLAGIGSSAGTASYNDPLLFGGPVGGVPAGPLLGNEDAGVSLEGFELN